MKSRTRLWTSYVNQCSSNSCEVVSTAAIARISASVPVHMETPEPQSRSVSNTLYVGAMFCGVKRRTLMYVLDHGARLGQR
jgi:hypothetical protein